MIKKLQNSFLYLDTALDTFEVCLVINSEKVFHTLSPKMTTGHGEEFFKELKKLSKQFLPMLKEKKIPLLVNNGPGRFNALRVGISFALTLGKMYSLDYFTINSFDIMRAHLRSKSLDDQVPLLIFAKWNHVYYQATQEDKPTLETFDNVCWKNAVLCGFEKEGHLTLSSLQFQICDQLLSKAQYIADLNEIDPLYLGHQIS